MGKNDWNPDDLLEFSYDHPVPGHSSETDEIDEFLDSFGNDAGDVRRSPERTEMRSEPDRPQAKRGLDDSFDSYDEVKRYEKLREQSRKSAASFDAHKYDLSSRPEASFRPIDPSEIPEPLHSAGRHAASEAPLYSVKAQELRPQGSHSGSAGFDDFLFEGRDVSSGAGRRASDDEIFGQFDEEHRVHDRGLVEDVQDQRGGKLSGDIEAIRQASHEARERYRSNYTKNKKKKLGKPHIGKFHKLLTVIYTIALAAFAGSMTYMNILPGGMLTALYVILALLSLLIFVQIRKASIKKWGRRLATFLAIVLVFFYGMGTAYALGTLSFLSSTSVDNEKAVTNITRDPFNVVITGMDVSGTIDEEGRSDVNMILTVNPSTAQVLMTSIPRDYEIYMPDKDNAMDKLTHTGFYSVNTTILAEEELLDITANYYVKVNFTTVEKFIDAIGGVDVNSEYEFNPVKMKDWTVKKGMNHMNGKQALAFARERKAFLTGDNQRIKNQQAVFEAMFKKATNSRTMIFSYNKILSSLKAYFEMSFSSGELRALARMQLAKDPDWKIFKNTIVGGNGSLPTYTTGGAYCYVMTQDEASIENAKTLINAVLEGKTLKKDKEDNVSVAESEEKSEE